MRDIILHAFDWPWAELARVAPVIGKNGFGAVLISPPLYSDEHGSEWWQRYQPRDYRIIRSALGTMADFRKLIAALHTEGVRLYVDIVFNHMANEKGQRPDPFDFPGKALLERYQSPDEGPGFAADRLYGDLSQAHFSPADFNPDGDIRNWMDRGEVMEGSLGGLPDLDLNPRVIGEQRRCLEALNALGVDGYRIDAMKHLPVDHLQQVFATPAMEGKFVFGETLTCNDQEEDLFLDPIIHDTSFPCYDFPLQLTLRRAFAPGGSLRELVDPASYGRALPWHRAVTVAITHDIPNNEGFRSLALDPQDEYLAQAYLCARDGGVPMIYCDRNTSARIHPEDTDRWSGSWDRPDIRAMVAFHNAVHGQGQRCLYESDEVLVLARGHSGFLAINKAGDTRRVRLMHHDLDPGIWTCLLHQWQLSLGRDPFDLDIPPRQALLMLHQKVN